MAAICPGGDELSSDVPTVITIKRFQYNVHHDQFY